LAVIEAVDKTVTVVAEGVCFGEKKIAAKFGGADWLAEESNAALYNGGEAIEEC
jgi:hypothetical protein